MADDPWDSFPTVSQPSNAAPQQGGDPWAAFPAAKQQSSKPPPSVGTDVARGSGLGLQEGAASILGVPSDIWHMIDRGYQWALTKGAEKIGLMSPEQGAALRQPQPGLEDYQLTSSAIMDRIKKADERLGAKTEAPQSVPGQYAETGAQFGLGAAALGANSLKDVPAAVAKYGLIPGAASETAGQITKGTSLEPYARVAGALAGAAPGMAFDAMRSGARSAAAAMDNLSPAQQKAAQALLDQSRAAGIPLSVPEAVQHVTNGATSLGDIQRVVEQSTKGGPAMRQFYAERPTQVEGAVRGTLSQIAPPGVPAEETASQVQNAANATIADADRARTQAVNPLYRAAETDQVPAQDMEQYLQRIEGMAAQDKTGILSPVLTNLRDRLVESPGRPAIPPRPTGMVDQFGQPIMSPGTPAIPRQPVTDIENLDRVRKFFRDRMEQPQWAQDAIPKEANAKVGSLLDDLGSMMEAHSPSFQQGRQLYQDISENTVNPLQRSPTGQLAAAETFPKQANILFAPNPAPGSEATVGNAVRSVAAKDPDAAAQLVRAHIEKTFNKATQDLQSGPNQWGGANFAKALMGNSQQARNLEAAVRALPNGDLRWNALSNTMQILRAQGMRQHVGSQTEFNRLLVQELRGGSPLGTVMATAASPGRLASMATKVYQDFMYGRNTGQLADLFTTGNVADLRKLATAGSRSIAGQAAVAGLLGDASAQQGRAAGGGIPDDLDAMIEHTSERYGISPPLLRRIMMVESGGQKNAVSYQGAQGPMQLMPATAKSLGVSDPFDYAQALDGGARLLRESLDRNNGRVDLAVAEYHGGPNRANWGPKTAAYVGKVLGSGGEGVQAQEARPQRRQMAEAIPQAAAPEMPAPMMPSDPTDLTPEENAADIDRRVVQENLDLLARAAAETA